MKKHITQSELTRTRKLISQGVTKVSEIQKYVFCDASCIRRVVKVAENQAEKSEQNETKADVDKDEPQGAAAKKAAKKVDPLS